MKRKSLKHRFGGYIYIAALFTLVLNIISFFVIYDLTGRIGADGESILRGYIIFVIIFWVAFYVDAVFVRKNMQKIEEPIKGVGDLALRVARGKALDPVVYHRNDELGDLVYAANEWLDYMHERCEVLDKINKGDYSMRLEPIGEVDLLTRAIIRVINTNNEILYEIKKAAGEINSVAYGISSGADTLSSGSTEQAATIEQFSAVMAEVQFMAEKTSEIAKNVHERAFESKDVLEKNTYDIKRMTSAMDSITESSHRIETVIKVIDEIAFQTNILALNAAIEAARAGVHGKGFAVVADEVRELAAKSAEAARETTELIQMSIQSVTEGNEIMKQTMENISSIEVHASESAENMDILAESSENQRLSISDINRGIEQISNVIQANSITAQENSMNAQKMALQSTQLQELVGRFKLRNHNEPPLPN